MCGEGHETWAWNEKLNMEGELHNYKKDRGWSLLFKDMAGMEWALERQSEYSPPLPLYLKRCSSSNSRDYWIRSGTWLNSPSYSSSCHCQPDASQSRMNFGVCTLTHTVHSYLKTAGNSILCTIVFIRFIFAF